MTCASDEKTKLSSEVHRIVASRDQKSQSNFVEVVKKDSKSKFRNYKIVYRRYAGLYFCFVVDAADNELATLESIHLFVEVLDMFFKNVCELDLVFHFYKCYAILDEFCLAGELQETRYVDTQPKTPFSKDIIVNRLEYLDRLE